VKLEQASGTRWQKQWNHATTAYGYASASAGPLHFGLGPATSVDRVEIRWPSGTLQVLEKVPADQVLTSANRPEASRRPKTRRAGAVRCPGPFHAPRSAV
jgi:hypothetical protein